MEGKIMHHTLKTWTEPFEFVWDGRKTYEIRKNDRDFNVGDIVKLAEWDREKEEFTGRYIRGPITYPTSGAWGIPDELIVFSFDRRSWGSSNGKHGYFALDGDYVVSP
jgi:hypothetical protein